MTYGTCLDPNLGHKGCNGSFVAIVHVLLRGQAVSCGKRTPEYAMIVFMCTIQTGPNSGDAAVEVAVGGAGRLWCAGRFR